MMILPTTTHPLQDVTIMPDSCGFLTTFPTTKMYTHLSIVRPRSYELLPLRSATFRLTVQSVALISRMDSRYVFRMTLSAIVQRSAPVPPIPYPPPPPDTPMILLFVIIASCPYNVIPPDE